MTPRQRKYWEKYMLEAEKGMLAHFARPEQVRRYAVPDGSFFMSAFLKGWYAAKRKTK